jgi:3-methyl-2-oxobutanoate hydroxymethyltransferase
MPEETAPYGSGPAAPAVPAKRVRTHHLREMKERGEKITMLTAYDMYTAATFDEAGIDLLLVGDSASNNVLGNETSLPVTVDELLPLTRAVARSVTRAMVVGDLPFGSYQASPEQGYLTAVRFMKEAGAHCVKLEGGAEMAPVIEKCTRGAVVMEMVPGDVAERISKELTIPTIGIGAGAGCDGQVLVWQDAFGLRTGRMARFVKQYADVHGVLLDAARAYADDVRGGTFPGPEHTF